MALSSRTLLDRVQLESTRGCVSWVGRVSCKLVSPCQAPLHLVQVTASQTAGLSVTWPQKIRNRRRRPTTARTTAPKNVLFNPAWGQCWKVFIWNGDKMPVSLIWTLGSAARGNGWSQPMFSFHLAYWGSSRVHGLVNGPETQGREMRRGKLEGTICIRRYLTTYSLSIE